VIQISLQHEPFLKSPHISAKELVLHRTLNPKPEAESDTARRGGPETESGTQSDTAQTESTHEYDTAQTQSDTAPDAESDTARRGWHHAGGGRLQVCSSLSVLAAFCQYLHHHQYHQPFFFIVINVISLLFHQPCLVLFILIIRIISIFSICFCF